jgi:hypothetical protein
MSFVHIQTRTRTDTQYKLEEAEFFLGHLRQNHGKFNKFNFYLSAYVGAALSVTDVMKREYTRRPRKFDDWFKKTKAARTVEDKALFALMEDMRQVAVHEGRLNARALYKVEFSEEDRRTLETRPVGRLLFSLNGHKQRMEVQNPETGERTNFLFVKTPLVRRYVLQNEDRDVLDLCERYLKLLVPFVTECTENFGKPPTAARKTPKK